MLVPVKMVAYTIRWAIVQYDDDQYLVEIGMLTLIGDDYYANMDLLTAKTILVYTTAEQE